MIAGSRLRRQTGSRPAAARPRNVALAALGYLLLTLVLAYPLLPDFATAIPGDSFDGWQNYWNQWWIKTALIDRQVSPYFTDLLYAPTGVSLLFHTLNPFNGLVTLPIQLAWGLIPAYNAAVLLSFVAGGLGAYLLARQVLGGGRGSRRAAFVAGAIFTFAPFHVAHLLGHMQLLALEWLPFYALYLWRLLAPVIAPSRAGTGRPGRAARAGFEPPMPAAGFPDAAPFDAPSGSVTPQEARGAATPRKLTTAVADRLRAAECTAFDAPAGSVTPQEARGVATLQRLTTAVADRLRAAQRVTSGITVPAATRAFPWRDALLAGLFLVLVGLCDWYYVMYCLFLTALALLWAGGQALHRRHARVLVRPVLGVLAAGAVFLVALGPLLVPMIAEARQSHYMVPDPNQSRLLSADLLAFVTPQEFHPLWGEWARGKAAVFTASLAEHQVFAGYSVLALAGLAVWAAVAKSRGRERAPAGPAFFWLAASGVFLILALGPVLHVAGRSDLLPGGRELPLPYAWLVRIVPFMNISRSVSRFDVMVMLALAVLAGLGLKWVLSKGRGGAYAGAVALALVIFEFWPAPFPFSPPDTPAWYTSLAQDQRPGAVLNLPMNWDRPWYLLYQTVHRKPLAVAYISRDDPRTLTERAPVLQHFRHLGPDIIDFDLAAQGRQVLSDLGIRWLVLDRYKMPGARERAYNEDTARLIFGSQPPVYQDDRLTVYEVTPSAAAAPYVILGEGWGALTAGTRSFVGSAPLKVQSPVAGRFVLRVTLAPGSAGLDGPGENGNYLLALQLQAGMNEIRLAGRDPNSRVVVDHLAISGA